MPPLALECGWWGILAGDAEEAARALDSPHVRPRMLPTPPNGIAVGMSGWVSSATTVNIDGGGISSNRRPPPPAPSSKWLLACCCWCFFAVGLLPELLTPKSVVLC